MAGGKGRPKKGSIMSMFDTLLTLLFLGIFIAAVFPFIAKNANSDAYFSRFYAVDLGTGAELVNAGYGDVVLRYDNLKPNGLTFWLDNGRVGVGKKPDGMLLADAAPAYLLQIPPGTFISYYGGAERYPAGPSVIEAPLFLVLRKNEGAFAITESETLLKDCPAFRPIVKREDAVVHLEVDSPLDGDERQMRGTFYAALDTMGLKHTDEDDKANVRFKITKQAGNANKIEFGPTSVDGKAFGCLFVKRLEAITLVDYESEDPSRSAGTSLHASIIVTHKDPIRNEQIAQALANALAVYY
jgi:hypothetical protein